MLQITSAKVTASPGPSGWVQVHGFSPTDAEKSEKKGHLFVVIASRDGREGVESITFERQIARRLGENYYGNLHQKAFDALSSATQKIVDEFSPKDPDIEITCCAFVGEVVYSSAFGGSKIAIRRDGSLATILESGGKVVSASGFPKEGDVIVIGTKDFFGKVDMESLGQCLVSGSPETAAEELSPLVYGGAEKGKAGAMIIKFEQEKVFKTETEAVVPQDPGEGRRNFSGKNFLGFIQVVINKLPKRKIYIRQEFRDEAVSQNRKLTLSIGIILLVILTVSVFFGIRQKRINNLKDEYKILLDQAADNLEQAINFANIDPGESRRFLAESERKLDQIKALKIKDSGVDELKKKIGDSRAAVLGEYISDPELFLDLSLLSSGFRGTQISASGGNLYVLDENGSRAVSVVIDTKKSGVVAGPAVIENPVHMASYEDSVYILFQDGIYLVGSTKTKVIDKTWDGDVLIYAFAGNLYVLDKSANQIYRYAGQNRNTFGSQQNWLSASTRADFSNAVSWGMDGAVYVLYPNSRILKYSLGSPQNFSISGVYPEIGNVDVLYADSGNQYIYLLDKAGKRVVAVDKNGRYKAQYLSDRIADVKEIVVSESAKKIILLTDEKLLFLELKNK